jgi:hypothetical protein
VTTVELVTTSAITLIGLYLAYSFHRQQRLKIAEQRIEAYRKLWSLMEPARPSRLDHPESAGSLSVAEARELYDRATAWYFEGGNGMMLTAQTRAMYLEAKRRLGAYSSGARSAKGNGTGGERRMRELSLLRTQMKFDLAMFGVFYPDSLDDQDNEFIDACGLDSRYWGRPLTQRLLSRLSPGNATSAGPRWPGRSSKQAPRAHD